MISPAGSRDGTGCSNGCSRPFGLCDSHGFNDKNGDRHAYSFHTIVPPEPLGNHCLLLPFSPPAITSLWPTGAWPAASCWHDQSVGAFGSSPGASPGAMAYNCAAT